MIKIRKKENIKRQKGPFIFFNYLYKENVFVMYRKPIVYSCSGCSLAGQCANNLALHLDKKGIAEMSCLAGIAAGKRSFINKSLDREIWVIDGCEIQCAKSVLQSKGMKETMHIKLYEHGIKKFQEPAEPYDFDKLTKKILPNA